MSPVWKKSPRGSGDDWESAEQERVDPLRTSPCSKPSAIATSGMLHLIPRLPHFPQNRCRNIWPRCIEEFGLRRSTTRKLSNQNEIRWRVGFFTMRRRKEFGASSAIPDCFKHRMPSPKMASRDVLGIFSCRCEGAL
jgi:hypothetical protein